jgi:hypothetical protein
LQFFGESCIIAPSYNFAPETLPAALQNKFKKIFSKIKSVLKIDFELLLKGENQRLHVLINNF